MKKLKVSLLLILLICLFNTNGLTKNKSNVDIPEEIQQKAMIFLDALRNESPDKIYSYFDTSLKEKSDIPKVSAMLPAIRKLFGEIEKSELVECKYYKDTHVTYSLVYNIETKGTKIEYSVFLKQTDSGIFVRGFNFKTNDLSPLPPPPPPPPLPTDKMIITPAHALIGLLFAACIIIQIWCIIFFVRMKNYKWKWMYVLLSLIGFPGGIGINWTTGAYILSFGFKVPAVAVSWPADQSGAMSIAVFFPIGLIFLIIEMIKMKRVKIDEPSDTE